MKQLQEKEDPDVVIGLFHSGWDGGIKTEEYEEDAALKVAQEVSRIRPGALGHDHTRHAKPSPIMRASRWFV